MGIKAGVCKKRWLYKSCTKGLLILPKKNRESVRVFYAVVNYRLHNFRRNKLLSLVK